MAHVPVTAVQPTVAIDNNPASDYYGRIYLVTNGIDAYHSDSGTDWSLKSQASPPASGQVKTPWPAVDPSTGHVYISYKEALNNDMRIWVVQSSDGGVSWSPRAFPQDWTDAPRHIAAATRCDRTAVLLGDIFIDFAPQLVVDGFEDGPTAR